MPDTTKNKPMKYRVQRSWIPDLPDNRDLLYLKIKKSIPIPDVVDWRSRCSPIEQQSDLGSCTAQALVAVLEFLMLKLRRGITRGVRSQQDFYDLSRLFLYYEERVIENSVKEDSGAMLRDGIKVLAKYGVCTEAMWPYDISKFANKPPKECYADAAKRKIVSYYKLTTLNDRLTSLTDGFPFVFGISLFDSFDTKKVQKTGIVPMPGKGDSMLGGHALCCVGFDKPNEMFIVRNSWGPEWGVNGYCYIPFKYLELYGDSFWQIRA